MMNKISTALSAVAALVATHVSALAVPVVALDAPLAPPGTYFGTGNPNIHWTVSTNNGVETGLEATLRYVGPITPTGSIYNAPTGATTVPGKFGPAWGLNYSINTRPGSAGSLTLGGIQATLTVFDFNTGSTASFNPLAVPDNAEYGAGGTVSGSLGCLAVNTVCGPTAYGAQNSEPASFLIVTGDPGYNVNSNDTYIISLSVFDLQQNPLSQDMITVNTGTGSVNVPEPGSLGVLALGTAGLAALRRRRKSA